MRANKWLSLVTFFCSVVALVVMGFIGNEVPSMIYDIALAIFGSALLGFIMSLTEYFSEKRKAMEQFWIEARKVLNELKRIEYVDCDAPSDLIIVCFQEEQEREVSKRFPELCFSEKESKAKQDLLTWFQTNHYFPFSADAITEDWKNNYYSSCIKKYKGTFQKTIESYCKATECDFSLLDNAYGSLDFLFGNHKFRSTVYENIFDKMRQYRNKILQEKYHFELLREGKGNFAVCAEKIIDLNQFFFEEKRSSEKDVESILVYQTLYDDVEEELENFRCKIYRNAQKEIPRRRPVFAKMIPIWSKQTGSNA